MATTPWQSAIVGYGEEAPDQLLANPFNWRTHPQSQKDALVAALDELGWIQNVIVNRVTGHMIDGHARVGEAIARGEATVPVTYVRLTPAQEMKALALLDPIGALAGADQEQLALVLSEVETGDPALQQLLADLAASAGLTGDGEGQAQDKFLVTVECTDSLAQQELLARLSGEGYLCKASKRKPRGVLK